MSPLACHLEHLELAGSSGRDIHDVTPRVAQAVTNRGVRPWLATAHTPGATAALNTIEKESGVLEHPRLALERLVPREGRHVHDARRGDGNGCGQARAALLGTSPSVPVLEVRPLLGAWRQTVVMDLDNRPRVRRVVIQALGE